MQAGSHDPAVFAFAGAPRLAGTGKNEKMSESAQINLGPGGPRAEAPLTEESLGNLNAFLATAETVENERVLWRYAAAVGIVAIVGSLGLLLQNVIGYRAAGLMLMLAVVAFGSRLGRGATLLAAAMSALFWDFLFLPPLFSLRISNFDDIMLFGMYFAVALVLGQLTARIRAQERVERRREEAATALFLLTSELTGANDVDEIVRAASRRFALVFGAEVAIWIPDAGNQLPKEPHPGGSLGPDDARQAVAAWVFERGQPAGKHTENIPFGDTLCFPLVIRGKTSGVMGLRFANPAGPTVRQKHLLAAFAQQIALALDRRQLHEESQRARLAEQSEKLSKTLLDSMSHELRTPLAVIESAGSNLVEFGYGELSPIQRELIAEIRVAADRLNRLVGKALDVTRLESGFVRPRLDYHEVGDMVNAALKATAKDLARHNLVVQIPPDLPRARMDFVLAQHSLANLLANAAFHTPAGTSVRLTGREENGRIILTVADRGPGIPPELFPKLFQKFVRGPGAAPGGTGLGLSLVKGFVEAQGGQIFGENQKGGGAAFSMVLPAEKPAPVPADKPA
jgi:two-component system sensor histidine kinase KdpD